MTAATDERGILDTGGAPACAPIAPPSSALPRHGSTPGLSPAFPPAFPPPLPAAAPDHSLADPPQPAPPPDAPYATRLASTERASADLLVRLRTAGLAGVTTLHLTSNRRTLVSYRAGSLRVHAAFATAPDDVIRAIAHFVSGRGAARAVARRIIAAHPLARDTSVTRPPRRATIHHDDFAIAERLQREHKRLNLERFGGTLKDIRLTVSRRMHTRLGHYAPARSHPAGAEIAVSRRHIRRHGWREALDTLLHEMVHQWQEENGHPIDHGATFRRKAHEVGATPRARRVLR